jgi:hypothetical protein
MTSRGKTVRFALVAVILAVASAGLAFAQLGAGQAPLVKTAGVVQEYTHQEVQAASIVATLNDLSKQGWDVFQIIPSWTIKNEDGTTDLTPKTYQVFARRAAAAK